MKKLRDVIAMSILLLFSLTIQSQQITIGLFQDAKLLVANDEHGNKRPTADLLLEIQFQGDQYKWGVLGAGISLEYADLSGGKYQRFYFAYNFTFNRFNNEKIELMLSPNFGGLKRWDSHFLAFGIDGTVSYRLNHNLRVSTKLQVVQAPDLNWRYNTANHIRYSGFVGVSYSVFEIDRINYKRNRENKKYQ